MRQTCKCRHQLQPTAPTLPPNGAVTRLKSPTVNGIGLMQEAQQSFFVLEAKTAPNKWQRIQSVYPLDDLPHGYLNKNEAISAKAGLKTLLLGKWKHRVKKYPIRIRETLAGSSSNIKKMEIS